ncbi:MAG: disulfide bond formation protein B [Pseudomonadota bacterium]
MLWNPRLLFLAQFAICACLLSYGYYLQYVEFLDPCPLCMVQRVCFFLVGAVSLVAAVHGPAIVMRRVYASLAGLAALVGALVAGRQIWLQHTPGAEMLECGAGLGTMLETMPIFDVMSKILKGTGDCATVQWTFMGLSIPEWAIVCFIAMLLVNIVLIARRD